MSSLAGSPPADNSGTGTVSVFTVGQDGVCVTSGGPTVTLKSRVTSVHPVEVAVTMTLPVSPWVMGWIVRVCPEMLTVAVLGLGSLTLKVGVTPSGIVK